MRVCGTWWLTQSCLYETELQKLHSRPKAQHVGKAIGLTAHVIETAKLCRLRALTGAAAAEGSSGGSAG